MGGELGSLVGTTLVPQYGGCGVMVALQTLTLSVLVRAQHPQPNIVM